MAELRPFAKDFYKPHPKILARYVGPACFVSRSTWSQLSLFVMEVLALRLWKINIVQRVDVPLTGGMS